MVNRDRAHFLLLNIGHFLDHLFSLIFATVAALALTREWELGYADLLKYATPGFLAFGLFSLPAGWLADKMGSRRHDVGVIHSGLAWRQLSRALPKRPCRLAPVCSPLAYLQRYTIPLAWRS